MAQLLKEPGFLTSLVNRLRAAVPGTVAPETEHQESEAQQSKAAEKAALKEQIDRKRKRDMVRRSEFNRLRQIQFDTLKRRKGVAIVTRRSGALPDFANSNLSQLERGKTKLKIDEIEAEMANQWGSQGDAKNEAAAAPPPVAAPQADAADFDLDFTAMGPSGAEPTDNPIPPRVPVLTELASVLDPDDQGARYGFLTSEILATSYDELAPLYEDAEHAALQEAAGRFAEGDMDGAHAALMAVLQSADANAAAAQACAAGLLHLYQASDQRDSFEALAIEYAQLFGRSAPEWHASATPGNDAADGGGATASAKALAPWYCPAECTSEAIAQLRQLANADATLRLHWGELRHISIASARELLLLLRAWAELPIVLDCSDIDVLLALLERATASKASTVAPIWWHLRLELLRLLSRQQSFEDLAMEYCITYEVSPPSWTECNCTILQNAAPDAHSAAELPPIVLPAHWQEANPSAPQAAATHAAESGLELQGVLQGDLDDLLARFPGEIDGAEVLQIQCERLQRVDFPASVSVLNWVQNRRRANQPVEFLGVPCLIAAYWDVIGISAQARVVATRR